MLARYDNAAGSRFPHEPPSTFSAPFRADIVWYNVKTGPRNTRPSAEAQVRSITVTGFVKNGVVVPNAPLPEGARVEILVNNEPVSEREKTRAAALDQFLALAKSSSFRSAGTYPTRDDLHERQ